METLLFALALEMTLLQMRILEGSTELRAYHLKCVNKTEKLQQDKLLRDRLSVKDVLRRTLIELIENRAWNTLQQATEILKKRASSAVSKRLENELLQISYDTIANDLKTKRSHWALELQNADQRVAFLRDNIKDDTLNTNSRLCYTEKWLCARAESLQLKCQTQPAPAPRFDYEQRVHIELLRAYELQIKERENSLEHWRVRYAKDTTCINQRLNEKQEQLRAAIARREELQKLYNLHEGEMRAWLTFKRERAARLAREERARLAATSIQAWWRGVMVRRALGPFRYLRSAKKSPAKTKKK